MRNTILLAAAMFIFSAVGLVSAQKQETEPIFDKSKVKLTEEQKERLANELQVYFEKLDLSDQQKEPFQNITIQYVKELKDLEDSDKSKFAKYRKYKSIKKKRNKEMKVVLTKKQYEIYKKLQKEMAKKQKEAKKKS